MFIQPSVTTRVRSVELSLKVQVWLSVLVLLGTVGCGRRVEQSLTRAVDAWDSGDYKVAAEEYERYLYQNPSGDKAADARLQLANIYYFKLQKYDRASANYTAFLEQNPSHPNAPLARERLAEVLGEMGRSYEAIAEYENLNPQDSSERRRIRLRIADLYFAGRNYSQALTEYDKVIENSPYDELSEQAYLREASVYHIERGQYQQALPVYQKLSSMSADPKLRARAMYGEAECYAGLYQFEEAIKTLRSIKDESEQADISRRIADLEQQKREAAQARSGLQTNEAKRATKSQNTNAQATESAVQNRNAAPRKTKNKSQVNNSNRNASVGQNKNETGRKTRNRNTANANEKKVQQKPLS
jgi:tetratricopeptide (TPR) repeat protein